MNLFQNRLKKVKFELWVIEKLGKRPAEPGGGKTRGIASLRN